MITDNTPENDQATIITPRNTPIFQNMPLTNPVVIQQKQVHMQTQVQEYERKSTMSRKVINETTLRIQIPRNSVADSTLRINSTTFRINSTASFGHFDSAAVLSQDEIRLFYLLHTHLQYIHCLHEFTWVS